MHIKNINNNKKPRLFVLCFPHLGTLDNWLPVVSKVNDLQIYQNFTLVVPNCLVPQSYGWGLL